MIDNSIQQGNPLNIDPRRITWKRCMDMCEQHIGIAGGLVRIGDQLELITVGFPE